MEPAASHKDGEAPEPTVIAFINPRSGGGLGQRLMEKLQGILGDDHVFDLLQGGPEPGLKQWKKTKNLRVIAGGGDGTVGWVLSICDKMKLKRYPMVVPMPLGTANDMSRVLRWGNNFTSAATEDVAEFVQNVKDGVPLKMDRWHLQTTELTDVELKKLRAEYGFASKAEADPEEEKDDEEDEKEFEKVTITSGDEVIDPDEKPDETGKKSPDAIKRGSSVLVKDDTPRRKKSSPAVEGEDAPVEPVSKEYVVNNYFSIGFDSQVMLDFHEQRHSRPGLFVHPVVNKAAVGVNGFNAGLKNLTSPALHKFVHFEMDGKVVPVPKRIHALVVLQIPSYASGTDIWGSYDKKENQTQRPTVNDGLFEVIGIKGILHMGRMFSGISSGLRLGQGKSCAMVVTQPIAMQVDGEPYWLNPARCEVKFHNQSNLLFNMKKKGEKKWLHLTGAPYGQETRTATDEAGSKSSSSKDKEKGDGVQRSSSSHNDKSKSVEGESKAKATPREDKEWSDDAAPKKSKSKPHVDKEKEKEKSKSAPSEEKEKKSPKSDESAKTKEKDVKPSLSRGEDAEKEPKSSKKSKTQE